jgi:DNA-binding NarL/FixJ family response regulator
VIRVVLAAQPHVVQEVNRHLHASPEFAVVGTALDDEHVLQLARNLQPDLMLIELGVPGLNGLDVTKEIVQAGLKTKVLILTTSESDTYLIPIVRAGARGFLHLSANAYKLVEAMRTILAGDFYLPVS